MFQFLLWNRLVKPDFPDDHIQPDKNLPIKNSTSDYCFTDIYRKL